MEIRAIRGNTVLITGITGFVGSHLAEYTLSLDGVHVYGTKLIL